MNETIQSECGIIGDMLNKNGVGRLNGIMKRNRGPFLNLVGQKFNRLTVIREVPKNLAINRTPIKWHCKCDCGKETVVSSFQLRHGRTKSCGCYRDECGQKRMQKPPYFWLLKRIPRDKPITLTYEELLDFVKIRECHYCGSPIEWIPHTVSRKNRKVNSGKYNLDRKNNSLGYSKDNCVVCCSECNYLKGDKFTFEEMIELGSVLKRLRENRQTQGIPWIKYY